MSKNTIAGDRSPIAPDRTMPMPRNPDIAVAEEYELAQRRGTAEALRQCIARHPESGFAQLARAELRRRSR